LKSSIHWFHKILLAAYVLGIIWTSFTNAAEYRVSGAPIPPSVAPLKVTFATHGRLNVRATGAGCTRRRHSTGFGASATCSPQEYVQSASKAAGVNPRIAEWIVSHESRHRPEATGDGGESRGLWQINKVWHPEVSDACAYEVACSTDWSLERIRAGYVDEWSTWKYCKERFEDCPF
jgi:hypothetical protein